MSTNLRIGVFIGIIAVGLAMFSLSKRDAYAECRLTGTWYHCVGWVTGVSGAD